MTIQRAGSNDSGGQHRPRVCLAEMGAAGVASIEGLTEGLTLTADAAPEIEMDTFTGSLEDGEGTLHDTVF